MSEILHLQAPKLKKNNVVLMDTLMDTNRILIILPLGDVFIREAVLSGEQIGFSPIARHFAI